MNQKTKKQYFLEKQKMEQLREDIDLIKRKMDQEYIQKLNNKNDPIYNIFLLGPSGAGKSTMANELIDARIVFQSEDEDTFNYCSSKQNQEIKFKIGEDSMRSETDMPQQYRVNQFQLCFLDLPGYFDCRCKYKDLKNIVSSQSLIQHSEYSQILIVVPASQFSDYRLEKLIKILNNIDKSNCEISLSLVISKVNGQKLDYFLKKLNELLKSDILQTGKELLLQILTQNRVIIFECPKQDPKNEDIYYFCRENVKQIKAQVFQTNRFTNHYQLKLNPPDETKIIQMEIENHYEKIMLHKKKLLGDDLFKEILINDQQQFKNQKLPFIEQLEKFKEQTEGFLEKLKQTQKSIIIIGESGSGKSTLCNILMNKNLVFKYEQCQFKPIEETGQLLFKISSDCTISQTNVIQVEKISDEFQIFDFPGLQDTKSGLNDILTCLNIQQIVNHSHAIQIVFVIPEKEITDTKFKNLIEILNQLEENTFTLTFLITHVDEHQTKQFFCEELEKVLDLEETKLRNKSKKLLKRSLDNKEERINILQQPTESEQEDLYEFNKDQIKSIKNNLLRQQFFDKENLVFSFTDVNKQEIKAQANILQQIQDQIWNILFKLYIKSTIIQNSFLLPNDEQKVQYLCELQERYKTKYLQNLDQINNLRLLVPEYKQLDNQYDNLKTELKKVIDFLEVDQQLSTIRIFCSFLSFSKLSQILKTHNQYDKVLIYSLVQFQVDESFIQPGLSIYIKTNQFIVTSQNYVFINLKGNDGASIHSKKAGQDFVNQKNGVNGRQGNNGQNGGNLYVDSQIYNNMNLLIIDVSGGNGGDGQDGGDGVDGENGKDAEQYLVDQKDKKYQVQYLEQIIDEKNLEKNENEGQVQNNKLPVQQQDIESQESNTLNKFNVVLLECKGYPGAIGGNSGAGGIGGSKGLKGQVKLNNFYEHTTKLIDQDGSNGADGKNGIVGKGGLQGKNYRRAYWDVKYYKGGMSKIKIFLYVVGSILTFGTLFVGLSVASLGQFLFKDGNWLTNGDFIQENIRADDGEINVRKSIIRKIEKVDHINNIMVFNQFLADESRKRNSYIFQYIKEQFQ